MRIVDLRINHLTNPLGYDLAHPTVSWIVEDAKGKYQKSARIEVAETEDFAELVYDSGEQVKIVSTGFELPVQLAPMRRYFWRVSVTDDAGDHAVSEPAWFETAKAVSGFDRDWQAQWITPDADKEVQAIVYQDVMIDRPVKKARAYMTGLGLYEFMLDGVKQGDDCLMPGFCDYDTWIQYQTYALDPSALGVGTHRVEMMLGDGWYKGEYGLRVHSENYGDRLAAIAELHLWYEDGSEQIIGTGENWKARRSPVVHSGIYPGETYDARLECGAAAGGLVEGDVTVADGAAVCDVTAAGSATVCGVSVADGAAACDVSVAGGAAACDVSSTGSEASSNVPGTYAAVADVAAAETVCEQDTATVAGTSVAEATGALGMSAAEATDTAGTSTAEATDTAGTSTAVATDASAVCGCPRAAEFGVRLLDSARAEHLTQRLSVRLSPPLTIHEHLRPVEVIHSPKGETILDMGQNMVGWISFRSAFSAGARIHLKMGEILQDGCFYNENLRTAKAEFIYISDGKERWVRQHFTFYGFRFVKVEGWEGPLDLQDFEGLVIHSQMEERGHIVTSDDLVNQLVHNARWGMKGNFVDVPTDCPQRDERYGWTGDAQIFSGTASFLMDTYAFYTKYGRDVYAEQCKLGGSVPDVVPVANYPGDASTAWADVATVLPWNVYLHSGDAGILRRQYDSMRDWVEYMYREDEKDGGRRLWATGMHYADWLALDGSWPGGVYGATDSTLIATAYYYYSTDILARAAKILEKTEDAAHYRALADEIRDAYVREYFTPAGRLAVDTMTAYVVTLYLGLLPGRDAEPAGAVSAAEAVRADGVISHPAGQASNGAVASENLHREVSEEALARARHGLLQKLKKRFYHLETGFVGTPWLCRVLSENEMNDLAYHLLLEKGYPGWLYQVTMGATTVWERWNSVNPDGKISGTEMNSLNHYSYGSIVEWMFRDMAGINPLEDGAGFKHFRLAPRPNYQIESASAQLRSASGQISSTYEISGGKLKFLFKVPFDTTADLVLPDADVDEIRFFLRAQGLDDAKMREYGLRQEGKDVCLSVPAGIWKFAYTPTTPYRKIYSIDSPLAELEENPKTRKILEDEYYSILKEGKIPFKQELCTLEEATWGPFSGLTTEQRARIDRLLRSVVE